MIRKIEINIPTNESSTGKVSKPKSPREEIEKYIKRKYPEIHLNILERKFFYNCKKAGIKELDILNVQRDIEINLGKSTSVTKLNNIMRTPDYIAYQNPVEEYFKTLPKWDGHDWIKDMTDLIVLTNEADRDRLQRQFRKMYIRSVATGLGKDYNKHCICLLGAQHKGKTLFTRFQCPPKLSRYIKENIKPDDKGEVQLALNFWVIMDEIDVLFERNSIELYKSMLGRSVIKEKLTPWDRMESVLPRISNFIASANTKKFLSDPTGSIRWICFEIDGFKHIPNFSNQTTYSGVINIDQVYAQAKHFFEAGENYQLTPTDEIENKRTNLNYYKENTAMRLVRLFFESGAKDDGKSEFMTATEICNYLRTHEQVDISDKLNNQINPVSIGKSLNLFEYTYTSDYRTSKLYPEYGYLIIKKY